MQLLLNHRDRIKGSILPCCAARAGQGALWKHQRGSPWGASGITCWGLREEDWRGLLEVVHCKASSSRGHFKAHLMDGNPASASGNGCKPLRRWEEPPIPCDVAGVVRPFQLGSNGKTKGMPSQMSLLEYSFLRSTAELIVLIPRGATGSSHKKWGPEMLSRGLSTL